MATPSLQTLSPHLFWDVDSSLLTWDENKVFIVQRILEYGLLSDWMTLYQAAGIIEIGDIAKQIRSLDLKSLSFISALSNIPITDFTCYNTQLSTPQHWNF
jgi:hypothetical protein